MAEVPSKPIDDTSLEETACNFDCPFELKDSLAEAIFELSDSIEDLGEVSIRQLNVQLNSIEERVEKELDGFDKKRSELTNGLFDGFRDITDELERWVNDARTTEDRAGKSASELVAKFDTVLSRFDSLAMGQAVSDLSAHRFERIASRAARLLDGNSRPDWKRVQSRLVATNLLMSGESLHFIREVDDNHLSA